MDKSQPKRTGNGKSAIAPISEQSETDPNHGREIVTGSFLNFGNIRNGRLINGRAGFESSSEKFNTNEDVIDGQNGCDRIVRPNRLAEVSVPPDSSELSVSSKAETFVIFEQKLREFVVDIERNHPEDLMDIHEFLHCYSLLTSPFYIDIVHKFFVDICRDFL